jgi:hypothetical protein
MWKKVLIVAGAVCAVALIARKIRSANHERALWHEATTAPELH